MNRKASMQLGINAIVVLIIALAILGLAMSFVTNLFRKGESQLGGIITNVEMPVRADASEPLKVEFRDITVKSSSKNTQLRVSVYNNNNFEPVEDVRLFMDCYNLETEAPEESLYIGAPPQKIPVGSDVGYGAIIVSDGTVAGTYPCRVIASTATEVTDALADPKGVSGQVFITVKA